MAQKIKKYQKKESYSYTFGAFPTFEMLKNRPAAARAVYVHPQMDNRETEESLQALCRAQAVPYIVSEKTVEKLREKDNVFIIGVFNKWEDTVDPRKDHVVLFSPSDMGNVGTILRTCLGFGIHDIVIIEPAADVFHPKTVRASMGALFHERIQLFSDFASYEAAYGDGRTLYPFVLNGRHVLQELERDQSRHYALIFGNEATGLPPSFAEREDSITIRQSEEVDSFNLSLAVGMAIYEFTK